MLKELFWLSLIPLGLILLNEGSKFITDNAIAISRRSGHSRFVIGILLVSSLAALPEILVSLIALDTGSPEIAMGNAISSHIVAISFVIGLGAMIAPLVVTREILLRDAIFLVTFTLVATALLADGSLAFLDGFVLLVLFVPYTLNLILLKRSIPEKEVRETLKAIKVQLMFTGFFFGKKKEVRAGIQWLAFGAIWTFIGAQFVVRGAIEISETFGISEWILGITIIGVGTSLPDIAAAYQATRRGHLDLALGEGMGAAIITLLLTFGTMGLFQPITFDLPRVLPMLVWMNVVVFMLVATMLTDWKVSRREGAVLFVMWIVIVVIEVFIR